VQRPPAVTGRGMQVPRKLAELTPNLHYFNYFFKKNVAINIFMLKRRDFKDYKPRKDEEECKRSSREGECSA
jgi:hypothetical protein